MRKSIFARIAVSVFVVTGLTSCNITESGPVTGRHVTVESNTTLLFDDSKPLMSIVVAKSAAQKTRDAASNLAKYLDKMTGGEFKVVDGDGTTGIAVGTVGDFPKLKFKPTFDLMDPGERQGYAIKSHGDGVFVIGATPQAVSYAVFDFLYRLGFRRYFPIEKWTIIPKKKRLAFSLNIREVPDYYSRNVWSGYNYWPKFRASIAPWNRANRGGGYRMNTGHAYGTIIRKNKKEFAAHPEYYGLRKGKRDSSKICVSNPALRQLVVDYALKKFEAKPELDSISMDPSDGGGWCECANCAKLGSPSDSTLLLANTVAEAVDKKFPGKRVGIYAYADHSPPPAFQVHPNVVANVATAFIRGGFTLDEIMVGWQKKGATLGIREYYDVYIWGYNAPGRSRGSKLGYLKKTIPEFYSKGARYMSAESNDAWAPNGLGHYLALRMLWNIKEAENIPALKKDFLENCFGPAAQTMSKFYDLLNGTNKKPLCSDLLGRMFRLLKKARGEAAGDSAILGRLDDLTLYARYTELLMVYKQNMRKAEALDNLLNFAAKMKDSRMIHSRAAFRRLNKKRAKNSPPINWKTPIPFDQSQIAEFITNGIASHKLLDFTPVSYSDNLVPSPVKYENAKVKRLIYSGRGTRSFFTWVDSSLKPIKLQVTGGLIKHYRDRGNVKTKLYKIGGASATGERVTLIQEDASVPPDGKMREVILTPNQVGLHKIVISDGGDMTRMIWEKGVPMTTKAEGTQPLRVNGSFFFYVPKGTKTLGFFCDLGRGQVIAPNGKSLMKFSRTLGFNSLPVPDGMDGKLWLLRSINGSLGLMTVPPYLAIDPSELLLPKEVVDQIQ